MTKNAKIVTIIVIGCIWFAGAQYFAAQEEQEFKDIVRVARLDAAQKAWDRKLYRERVRTQKHNEYLFRSFIRRNRLSRNIGEVMGPKVILEQVMLDNGPLHWMEILIYKDSPRYKTKYWLEVNRRWVRELHLQGKRFRKVAKK
jgi:hypothetical protein